MVNTAENPAVENAVRNAIRALRDALADARVGSKYYGKVSVHLQFQDDILQLIKADFERSYQVKN